ncbi:hypothetical protein HNQ96_004639 [Aminobacter lissarensis]|uniref:Uncharacterized protein n=1 Tax=Aminobacter carboxidus TaxID=376165 RepID=A0A8E1WHQ9_9HYPH|nr:hypothetical protein [Aminobacter lissarensis]MBB6468752.1 hypothetical protein [Aminobacter lissarensis]
MRARTATHGDVEKVFNNLANRMLKEYAAAGMDAKSVYDNLVMNLKEGRAHALVEGDRTMAIIAWHEDSDAAETLFAAQDDFFTAATLRFCKRHIRQIQQLAGNIPIRSRDWLGRPDVARWFRIIGYVERERRDDWTLFELPPEKCM